MGKPVEVTDTNFQNEVLKADLPVLVDFWAPWCVPCRSVAPIIELLAEEYDGKIKVCKLNTDDNRTISRVLNIKSIPTIAVFYKGKVQDIMIGARSKRDFVKMVETVIKKTT